MSAGVVDRPAAEIPAPQKLALNLWVNDELMRDSNTSQMIFTTTVQIAQPFTQVTLQPGDLILTPLETGMPSRLSARLHLPR